MVAIILAILSAVSKVQAGETYCNPIDIDYKYNFEGRRAGISYRSGADPVIINHEGKYYLFETIGYGFWRSDNLRDWEHVKPAGWPQADIVAPAALSAKGKLFLFPSTYEQRPIYVVTDPAGAQPKLEVFNDSLPLLPGAPGPWDPALFHDEESDAWFMYFGSSNLYPIYGIALDAKLNYRAAAQPMITLQPEIHGWERFGQDHRFDTKPFTEGAWMTKYAGKYYLQSAAPGTEYNVYANGVYVGDKPMGPFTYAAHNPFSYKPGGFVQGAGHGNTFQDKHGNYWNTGTPWVAVNYDFERRIAMFPAGFDKDGVMFANTRFGDFPQRVPKAKWAKADDLFAGWMLLSYRKPVSASSTRYPFGAGGVTDENPRTFWLAEKNGAGEWLTVDLANVCEVRALQVNFTDYKSGLFGEGPEIRTQFVLRGSVDGKTWTMLADLSGERRDRPNAYLELKEPARVRFVRYEHIHVGSPNLAISDLRVFGKGVGDMPATPGGLNVRRDGDARNAHLVWRDVEGAVGYNVRWGIAADKLYSTYQMWGDQRPRLEIRSLTVGQKYFFAIESFNEVGVSKLSDVVEMP
ncbi:MAG TPA: family 43 glycosylhydrolase [Verrucomicrobiae bacterium]|nr:family 43 glycosylhydrolase [Verrucomicrobiae bacterium]